MAHPARTADWTRSNALYLRVGVRSQSPIPCSIRQPLSRAQIHTVTHYKWSIPHSCVFVIHKLGSVFAPAELATFVDSNLSRSSQSFSLYTTISISATIESMLTLAGNGTRTTNRRQKPPPQQQMYYGPPQGQYQQGPPPKQKKDRGCLTAW